MKKKWIAVRYDNTVDEEIKRITDITGWPEPQVREAVNVFRMYGRRGMDTLSMVDDTGKELEYDDGNRS